MEWLIITALALFFALSTVYDAVRGSRVARAMCVIALWVWFHMALQTLVEDVLQLVPASAVQGEGWL